MQKPAYKTQDFTDMQIETFKILADLAETTSFSEAAERNGMTQSAVSQHIKVLEERFGVTLVERGGRNFSVTPEGDIFLKAGAEILESYVTIWSELELLKNSTSGVLKLATVFSIGFNDLPPLVENFRETYPQVNLELKYMQPKEVYASVLDNKADLGVVAFPESSSRIETCTAWQERLGVICSQNHKLATRRSIELKDLMSQRYISFNPDPQTQSAINEMFHASATHVKQIMEFDNIETVKRGVEIEDAISIVPLNHCQNELNAGVLIHLNLTGTEIHRPLGILRRRNKLSTRPMDAMVEMLQNVAV